MVIRPQRTVSTLGFLVRYEKHSGLRAERRLFEMELENKESNGVKLRNSNFEVYSW